MKVQIANWISTQVYSLNNNKIIAYIFNHKSNELIELESFSALLWQKMLKNPRIKDINKNQSKKDIKEIIDFRDELTDFLSENGFLSRLFLEMTYNCNLKCIHCFNQKNSKPLYIKFEDIKSAIDEAVELGIFFVTLSGGECTINPDFVKTLEYIREKRIAFEFFTNGQTLYDNKELFKKIINLYPFKISLSLYSMNEKTHDKITGIKGSHFKTLNAIKQLKENNINVEIKCFLTKYNASDYKDIQTFAKENDISLAIDYTLVSNFDNSNNYVRITEKQLLDLLLDENSLCSIKKIKPYNINEQFKKLKICKVGHNCLLINPNLGIYLCPAFKISLGNCKTTSLKAIWQDKNTSSKLFKIKSLRKIDLKNCYKKEECKYCVYCPAISHSSNCYLKPYKYFCRESKVKLKAAKLAGIYNA